MRITRTLHASELVDADAPTPVGMSWDFEVEITAEGHRREDGLTAAEVRAELETNRAKEQHGA